MEAARNKQQQPISSIGFFTKDIPAKEGEHGGERCQAFAKLCCIRFKRFEEDLHKRNVDHDAAKRLVSIAWISPASKKQAPKTNKQIKRTQQSLQVQLRVVLACSSRSRKATTRRPRSQVQHQWLAQTPGPRCQSPLRRPDSRPLLVYMSNS